MSEKIIEFPGNADWFFWRNSAGELFKLQKGRYAILRDQDGTYREEYLNPDLDMWEDVVLEHEGNEKIEVVEIRCRKDFEDLLVRCEELNRGND